MIESLLRESALQNLEETYLAVGRQGDGAAIERWDGAIVCVSDLGHPVSNFAIVRSLDARVAQKLTRLASRRPSYNAYVLPGSDQKPGADALLRAGWQEAGSMAMLVGGEPRGIDAAAMRELSSFEERVHMGQFMARQFFQKQTSSIREAIARATASSGLALYGLGDRPASAGAMVSRDDRSFGIYNLCVEPAHRRKGLGSAVLEFLLTRGRSLGLQATLQCDGALEPWYRLWHFQSAGTIRVFNLELKSSPVIM